MYQDIKRQKGDKGQTIAVVVETRVGGTPEKGVICAGKKFYRPLLPYIHKQTELSEDLNDGMEWDFVYYGISSNQVKDPLPHRYDMV